MRDYGVCRLLIVAAFLLTGCGKDSTKEAQNKASAALDRVLDAWARGESPEKYTSDQSIQLVDPDWKAGYRLLSFLTAETRQVNGNPDEPVRCRVKLALKDRKGRALEKEVVYLVKMGEPIVISRDAKP